MKVSVEISHNLRILGLSPGATPSEVRSAFRRLARTCHPDIAGRQSARRFEQITGAYTFLKNLPQDELPRSETETMNATAPASKSKPAQRKWIWEWKWDWENPLYRRRRKKESQEASREAEQ